jgi:hypothetical protein
MKNRLIHGVPFMDSKGYNLDPQQLPGESRAAGKLPMLKNFRVP